MSLHESAGIIVLSGPMYEEGQISSDTRSRFEAGLRLWKETGLPLILVGGSSELMFAELGELSHGPPEDAVHVEPKSRDTVGNAIYSKVDILQPKGFVAAKLVTADYHTRRATAIFRRALGPGFEITPAAAKTDYSSKERSTLQKQEIFYYMLARAAFRGYDPASASDHEKVMARMHKIARARYNKK